MIDSIKKYKIILKNKRNLKRKLSSAADREWLFCEFFWACFFKATNVLTLFLESKWSAKLSLCNQKGGKMVQKSQLKIYSGNDPNNAPKSISTALKGARTWKWDFDSDVSCLVQQIYLTEQ